MAEIEAEPEFVEKIEAFGEKMVSLQPKNSGGPIVKFWDAPETITALEHVKGWLSKHAKKVTSYCCLCLFNFFCRL